MYRMSNSIHTDFSKIRRSEAQKAVQKYERKKKKEGKRKKERDGGRKEEKKERMQKAYSFQ